jgi:hypothetical protein
VRIIQTPNPEPLRARPRHESLHEAVAMSGEGARRVLCLIRPSRPRPVLPRQGPWRPAPLSAGCFVPFIKRKACTAHQPPTNHRLNPRTHKIQKMRGGDTVQDLHVAIVGKRSSWSWVSRYVWGFAHYWANSRRRRRGSCSGHGFAQKRRAFFAV